MGRALSVLSSSAEVGSCEAGVVTAPPPRPAHFDRVPTELVDGFGRRITYVRLSVTDRCDLACVYCMPPLGERDHERRAGLLDEGEIARLAALFARSGVRRLRFTGGEPMVRRGLTSLVAAVHAAAPALQLALTTNGMQLEGLAALLASAGLSSVNVSVDSLEPRRFEAITRGGSLAAVLAGVQAAIEAGLEVKINTVVLGRRSLEEIPALIDWAWSLGVTPRFIELMPIGEAATLPASDFVGANEILAAVRTRAARAVEQAGPLGPASYYAADDGRRVGLIAATSRPFCDHCNRIRVTAGGELRGCLGSPGGVALRNVLRASDGELELAWALHSALRTKAARHAFEAGPAGAHRAVGMSLVGG
jgi:cyclic pyranopterin phosphate synthase